MLLKIGTKRETTHKFISIFNPCSTHYLKLYANFSAIDFERIYLIKMEKPNFHFVYKILNKNYIVIFQIQTFICFKIILKYFPV